MTALAVTWPGRLSSPLVSVFTSAEDEKEKGSERSRDTKMGLLEGSRWPRLFNWISLGFTISHAHVNAGVCSPFSSWWLQRALKSSYRVSADSLYRGVTSSECEIPYMAAALPWLPHTCLFVATNDGNPPSPRAEVFVSCCRTDRLQEPRDQRHLVVNKRPSWSKWCRKWISKDACLFSCVS